MVFDTVGKLGWKVDVRKHVIRQVISKVIEIDGVEWEDGRELPLARVEEDCVVSYCCSFQLIELTHVLQDCYKWEFGNFKGDDDDKDKDSDLY